MSEAQASLFVDTSVWSLALRRDKQPAHAAVAILERALLNADSIIITGIVLQELLQGFRGPRDQARLLRYLQALPLIEPTRETHVRAAELRNTCRRRGVQLGTVDALIAQLCIENDLVLLTTDKDFTHAARWIPLRLAV